jgi:serine/threonine-protein kinase
MLGPYGETLVVDWGLAKARDEPSGIRSQESEVTAKVSEQNALDSDSKTLTRDAQATPKEDSATQAGSIVGTPAYMAPEQAAGKTEEVGPASDIYSLGAILYHTLAGRPPISTGTLAETLRRVQDGDFPPARRVNRHVPAALDAVCRRAMALKPADRYSGALDLAAEVERWLADEPVNAFPEPWTARMRRWARRHRTVVAAALALLLTSVAGLAIATILIRSEQKATLAQKQLAEEQRDRADRNLKLAQQAVDAAITRVSANPRLREADFTVLRRDLLGALVPFYEEFVKQEGNDTATATRRGVAYGWLGSLRYETGMLDDAAEAYRRMQSTFRQLTADHPDIVGYRVLLARAHNDLGALLLDAGQSDAAAEELSRALALKEKLSSDQPDNAVYRRDLAATLTNLAQARDSQNRPGEAASSYARAVEIYESLHTQQPADASLNSALAAAENNWGTFLKKLGRLADAQKLYERAIQRRTQLVSENPTQSQYRADLAGSHFNLGNLFLAMGRRNEAVASYHASKTIYDRLVADFPSFPSYRHERANALTNLGTMEAMAGQTDAAMTFFREALAEYDRLVVEAPGSPRYREDSASAHYNCGELWREMNKLVEAEAEFRRAADIYAALVRTFPKHTGYVIHLGGTEVALGDVVRARGDNQAAVRIYSDALERMEPHGQRATAQSHVRDAHSGRGAAYAALGQHRDALAAWDRALSLDEPPGGFERHEGRARALAATGDGKQSLDVATTLASRTDLTGRQYDGLARIAALVAARKDSTLAEPAQVRFLEWAEKARQAGYYRSAAAADALRKDADFDSIRETAPFQTFLSKIERP